MKIIQVGPYPPPMGGWTFHIKVFKEYLEDHGYESEVINIGRSRKKKGKDFIDVQNGIDYVLKNIKYQLKGYKFYNHLDGMPLKGFLLIIISQLIGICFFRRASVSFHAGVNQKCFDKSKPFYRLLGKMVFLMGDRIICNSAPVKEKIVELGICEDKVFPVPCFTSQYLEFDEVIEKKQQQFMDAHGPLIFTYTWYGPEFTLEILVHAFDKLKKDYPDLGMVMVGPTRGSEGIQELIGELGLSGNILIAGNLQHNNFLTILKKSDVYVRTHLNDGVCSSVLESLYLGVPVVASANETRPKHTIIFEGGNGEELYEQTLYALKNINELKRTIKENPLEDVDNLKKEFQVIVERLSVDEV